MDEKLITPEIAQFIGIENLPEYSAIATSLPIILDGLIDGIDATRSTTEVLSDRELLRLTKHAKSIGQTLRSMDLVFEHWLTLPLAEEQLEEVRRLQNIKRTARVRLSVIEEAIRAAGEYRAKRSN